MTTANISQQIEQEQRIRDDFAALEAQLNSEADRYNAGFTDAESGNQPNVNGWKTDLNYRYGWLAGIAQRYDNEIGTAYNEPF